MFVKFFVVELELVVFGVFDVEIIVGDVVLGFGWLVGGVDLLGWGDLFWVFGVDNLI